MESFDEWQAALFHLDEATQTFLNASSHLRATLLQDFTIHRQQSSVNEAVAGINSHRASIDSIEARLAKSLSTLDQIFSMSTVPAPIGALPAEILYYIFRLAIMTPSSSSGRWYYERNTLLTISSVCTRWRRLATQASSLWSHIDLHSISEMNEWDPYTMDRIKLWLERSRGSPIHIYLPHEFVNLQQAEELCSVLQPYATSISSIISHAVWDPLLFREIYALFTSHGKPHLIKALTLLASGRKPLPHVAWQAFTSFTGLVSLELRWLPQSMHPTINQLAAVLSNNPSIRTLRLREMNIIPEGGQSTLHVTLPNLRLLDVYQLGGLRWLMSILLPGTLELDLRLDLHHLHLADPDVLARFFERAHVVCLWINDFSLPAQPWFPILPAVRVLGLVSDSSASLPLVDNMILSDGETRLARYPNVRIICLIGPGEIDELGHNRVQEMVECYSLSVLSLQQCGILPLFPEGVSAKEREFRALVSRNVGRVTLDDVDLDELDLSDIYIQTLIEGAKNLTERD